MPVDHDQEEKEANDQELRLLPSPTNDIPSTENPLKNSDEVDNTKGTTKSNDVSMLGSKEEDNTEIRALKNQCQTSEKREFDENSEGSADWSFQNWSPIKPMTPLSVNEGDINMRVNSPKMESKNALQDEEEYRNLDEISILNESNDEVENLGIKAQHIGLIDGDPIPSTSFSGATLSNATKKRTAGYKRKIAPGMFSNMQDLRADLETVADNSTGRVVHQNEVLGRERFPEERNNTTVAASDRVAGIILKIAEQCSLKTGISPQKMVDNIIASTISTSIVEISNMELGNQTASVAPFVKAAVNQQTESPYQGNTIPVPPGRNLAETSSPNPIRLMTNVITPVKIVSCRLAAKEIAVPLPSSWRQLPISSTKSGRRFGNGWTDLFAEALSSNNKGCSWVFRKNYIRVDASRKKDYPYWQGTAMCELSSSGAVVQMRISKPTDSFVKVIYSKNPSHDGKKSPAAG